LPGEPAGFACRTRSILETRAGSAFLRPRSRFTCETDCKARRDAHVRIARVAGPVLAAQSAINGWPPDHHLSAHFPLALALALASALDHKLTTRHSASPTPTPPFPLTTPSRRLRSKADGQTTKKNAPAVTHDDSPSHRRPDDDSIQKMPQQSILRQRAFLFLRVTNNSALTPGFDPSANL
ncbi:hypothetical protein FRC07_005506, partial [Ceratobasidium sp. 392]